MASNKSNSFKYQVSNLCFMLKKKKGKSSAYYCEYTIVHAKYFPDIVYVCDLSN